MKVFMFITILGLIQTTGCVLNLEQETLQKSKVKSTISGQITMLFNAIIPSAHANEPTLCSSAKTSGSKLFATLIGLNATGARTTLCEADVTTSGTYNFDILVDDLESKYSLLSIEVTDTRTDNER